MNKRMLSNAMLSMVVILVAFAVNGCKEEKAAQSNSTPEPKQHMESHEGHDHAAMGDMKMADTAEPKVTLASAEQEICPIMGGKINKAVFTEYKGKKVYFCCAGCDKTFNADPQKYISKLPQFNE